jgi:predicted transglutaminase-like cysteine proteinase
MVRGLGKVSVFGLVFFSLAMGQAVAQAPGTHPIKGNFDPPPADVASATATGKTLPPIGYVEFCGRGGAECKFSGGNAQILSITSENWDQVQQVNRLVNTKIRPATDMELYGVPDYWTIPTKAGDCEDYVLLKKKYLVELGFQPEDLLITVVLDENREGHAVLTVVSNKGDFILDNRRQEILRWDQTGYIFLKRQSQEQANKWVSLQKSAPQVTVSTRAH